MSFLSDHRRCETIEAILQSQMTHLRERVETLEEEMRQQRLQFEVERKEMLDRLLVYANPNAAAYIERMQRGLIPNAIAPMPQPAQIDTEAMKMRESDRGKRSTDPTPRRPILTPEAANFRPLRSSGAIAAAQPQLINEETLQAPTPPPIR